MRITKENLTRYDQHFKSWHRRRLGYGKALENWHQTEEAGAVQFYPVGGSALEGKVKFSFKETPPASGDKSPSNPSTITGVSQVKVTRCGKNICPSVISARNYSSAVSITKNSDGSFTFNGTVPSNATLYAYFFDNGSNYGKEWPKWIKHNTRYYFSMYGNTQDIVFAVYRAYGSSYGGANLKLHAGETGTLIMPDETSLGMLIRFEATGGTVLNNATVKVQIEESSAVTDFEPYAGTDYTIDLGNTYYGGEIDLATGLMTVTHEHFVFSGGTNINDVQSQSNGIHTFAFAFNSQVQSISQSNNSLRCSHFPNTNDYKSGIDGCHFSKIRLYIDSTVYSTKEDFKAWLASEYSAGHPVTVAYQLENPYTVQLSPLALAALAQTSRHEPRLNTVYTDADSIQITYQKSPIRAATEQEMAILGLGGNV